jgi:OmcA/MtrC family decaheme c-type cytochrome
MKKLASLLVILGIILISSGILLAQAGPSEGILSEITNVSIGEDMIPIVTFTLTDADGNPLKMEDVASVRFLMARVDEDETYGIPRYFNYFKRDVEGAEYQFGGETLQPVLASASQPTFESGEGVFAELESGVYTYTFGQALGDNYDERRTHVAGIVVAGNANDISANAVYTFVPDGREVRLTRDYVDTAACSNCHGELDAHGGSRDLAEICVLCHTPDNIDPETGNSLEMKIMIHRIHSGENLPSVQEAKPYYIVGRRGSIHDYSTVAFPQDTRNCTTCHTEAAGDQYLDFPNIAACTSCHDNVDPSISLNHPGRAKDDSDCFNCHYPELEEFDNESILGAHVIPSRSQAVTGVNFEILAVENAASGQSPRINFRVTNNAGEPISPEKMDYLAVTVAGPTIDYVNRTTETIYRIPSDTLPAVVDLGDGAFSYTLAYVLPEDGGTYAFGLEGYVMEKLQDVEEPVRIAGFNPVTYVNLNGSEAKVRREVISLDNCNTCHRDLALHGTIRQNTEYCVFCHNPNATDEVRRPESALPPVSINFPLMIHSIHRGEEANQPFIVYGFGSSLQDFGEVRFPGDISACTTCHLDGTYNNLLDGRQPTVIMQGDTVISVEQANSAVCTSCHDTLPAEGHTELQTTDNGIETCAVCHGAGREFDITNAHP